MEILFYVCFGLLVLTGLLGFALFGIRRWGETVLRRLRDRAALRGEDSLRGEGLANFRGRASDGYPLRGNAAVLLTTRAFHVVTLWPRREISVPLERMVRLEVTRSFMGRFEPAGFLVVHFKGDDGEDAVGLTLRRLPLWVAEIVKAARPYLKQIQGQNIEGAAGGTPAGAEPPAAAPKTEGGGAPPPASPRPARPPPPPVFSPPRAPIPQQLFHEHTCVHEITHGIP